MSNCWQIYQVDFEHINEYDLNNKCRYGNVNLNDFYVYYVLHAANET